MERDWIASLAKERKKEELFYLSIKRDIVLGFSDDDHHHHLCVDNLIHKKIHKRDTDGSLTALATTKRAG